MAACAGHLIHLPLHCHHRTHHATIHGQVHAVRLNTDLSEMSSNFFVLFYLYSDRGAREAIASGGSFAEEVISTVRTAHAFGTQKILGKRYDVYVDTAAKSDQRGAIAHGFGLGSFFFCMYSSYGLAFYYGTTLVLEGRANVGTIVNV